MLGEFEGRVAACILILSVWMYLLIRKGQVAALGASMVVSFAFPVWIKFDLGGLPMNVRTLTAILNMAGFLCNPRAFNAQRKIIVPLTLLDFCIAMICLIHMISDSFAGEFSAVLPFRAYGEWILPYVAGRYAIRDRSDLRRIAAWVAGLLVVLGVTSCFESLTGINPFEVVFGNRPVELAGRHAARFGLKRAYGPTTHSIFLGMMIALLMPWLVCLWQSSSAGRSRALAGLSGAIAIAGILSTGSRTPLLTVIAASAMASALRVRPLRWPLLCACLIMIGAFLAFPNEVTDTVSRWTGGGDKPGLIAIDGEAVVTSSSRSRLHVFGIYKDALIRAGLFGYGSKLTTGFPLKIPSMAGKFRSANLFSTVDNAYVLLTLRFGWLGGGCLIILLFTAIGTGFSLYRKHPDVLFPGAAAALLSVVAGFSLFLVFMNYDFGLPLLWTLGVLSGMESAGIAEGREGMLAAAGSDRAC